MKFNLSEFSCILSAPTTPLEPIRQCGRQIAMENEIAVLTVIRQFGHLRTAEIAAAVWPDAKYSEQLAQRTLRRLAAKSEVLQRVNTLASRSWVLAAGGASRLELFGTSARHGRDIVGVAGSTFVHRTLATAYLVHRATLGDASYGEYALAHGLGPVTRQQLTGQFNKAPDGLTVRGAQAYWVEVEASAKPLDELKSVLRVAERVGQPLSKGAAISLAGLHIVFDRRQDHGRRIVRAAREQWGDLPRQLQENMCSRITVVLADVRAPLRISGFENLSLLSLRRQI
ncbi:MAG: hypothetical protein ACXU8N_06490 [Telluria sp.]